MKMTMHIDEALLARVMEWTGAASKTEAVELALKEMDRKGKLREYGKKGMGLKAGEIKAILDPAYDLMALRLAEAPAVYSTGKKKQRKPRS